LPGLVYDGRRGFEIPEHRRVPASGRHGVLRMKS